MSKNVGSIERIIRIIAGIILLGFAFAGPKAIWGYIGIVPLLTGLVGICPIYSLLGRCACDLKGDKNG